MTWGMKKFKQKTFDIDYALNDNQIINKFGLKMQIISLPGHTKGAIGILYDNYLFCGDALVNRKKKFVELAYQNQDNDKAKYSALKILKYKPKIIFVGHDKEIRFDKFEQSLNYMFGN